MGERLPVAVLQEALHQRDIEPADPIGQPVLAENRQNLAPAIDVAIDVGDRADFHASNLVPTSAWEHRLALRGIPLDR